MGNVTFAPAKFRVVFNLVYFNTGCSVALKIMKFIQYIILCMCSPLKNFQVQGLCVSLWIYCCLISFSRVKVNTFYMSINVGNLFMHSLSVVFHDRKVVLLDRCGLLGFCV